MPCSFTPLFTDRTSRCTYVPMACHQNQSSTRLYVAFLYINTSALCRSNGVSIQTVYCDTMTPHWMMPCALTDSIPLYLRSYGVPSESELHFQTSLRRRVSVQQTSLTSSAVTSSAFSAKPEAVRGWGSKFEYCLFLYCAKSILPWLVSSMCSFMGGLSQCSFRPPRVLPRTAQCHRGVQGVS